MSVALFGTARSKWMSNEAVRVCSLLKEAQPLGKRFAELGSGEQWHAHDDAGDEEKLARGRLLSRYGVWMLVELCPPNDNADVDVLGRLISMLFQVHSSPALLLSIMLQPNIFCSSGSTQLPTYRTRVLAQRWSASNRSTSATG